MSDRIKTNKNILVTGGAGFIGTNCLRYLRNQYPQARLISYDISQPFFPLEGVEYVHGDIRSYGHLKQTVKTIQKVFHFAAELGTHETFSNPDITNDINIGGTINLLELAREYGFSLAVISKPNIWLNPYSISKEAAEQYTLMYFREFQIPVVVMKYFSVYGPYQYVHKYRKAVPYFIYQALNNKPIEIYGNWEQEADFLYAQDAVKAADLALEKNVLAK